jgi:hypothetical protein
MRSSSGGANAKFSSPARSVSARLGGGAQFANDLSDRLLMWLFYYRLYLTQELMTLLFKAADKSLICRSIQLLRPVFESVLPVPERAR